MNNKGSTLTMVIIVSAVLIIFAFSLGSLSLSETKHVVYQEKKLQAYYIARAGAETAATWINDDPKTAIEIIDKEDQESSEDIEHIESKDNVFLDMVDKVGYYDLDITKNNVEDKTEKITITSTGKVENGFDNNGKLRYVTDKVTIVMEVKKSVHKFKTTDFAIYAKEKIKVDSGDIVGPVKIDPEATVNGFYGEVEELEIEYPSPQFADFNREYESGYFNNTIDRNTYISYLSLKNNESLEIKAGLDPLYLKIDNLDLKGSINFIGSGQVNIYIGNTSKLQGSINKADNPNVEVNIYYDGTEAFNFHNQSEIHANIYLSNCDNVNFNNHSNYSGSILSNNDTLNINGNNQEDINTGLIYAPNASIILNNKLNITGSVIGQSITLAGNSTVIYDPREIPISGEGSNVEYDTTKQWQ